MNWQGPERRSYNYEAKLEEILREYGELSRGQRALQHDIKCLKDSIEKYEPYLESALKKEARWATMQDALIEKSMIAAIWTAGGILAYVGWEYIKNHGMWKP